MNNSEKINSDGDTEIEPLRDEKRELRSQLATLIEQNKDLQANFNTISKKMDDTLEHLKNIQAPNTTTERSNEPSDNDKETPAAAEPNASDATRGNDVQETNDHEKTKTPRPISGKVNCTDAVK